MGVLLAAVGGCSGGSITQSDQVIVRLIGVDVDSARRIAQAECNRSNGQARFLTVVGSASGAPGYDNPEPPSAVFACDRGH
jgi:hypothetical protein